MFFGLLSQHYPQSGGESEYVHQAFGRKWLTQITGLAVICTGVLSASTVTQGFVGYLQNYVGLSLVLLQTITVCGVIAIACWGISESITVAAVLTVLEIAGLLFAIIGGWHFVEPWLKSDPHLVPVSFSDLSAIFSVN